MSTAQQSSFFKPRYLSDISLLSAREDGPTYDLFTFLAVTQKLQIGMISTTWEAARQPIGVGATGRVNQALINLHTSLAFKCVSDRQKERESEKRIFEALLSEVIALGHPVIRNHPNIVEIQGICWDVTSNGRSDASQVERVWPVLVFEKSQYGDLYNFLILTNGRDLSFNERMKLCLDVGIAISDMHVNNIIHGDLKPENVLIFKDSADTYTARVTDFGYSTRFACEEDLVSVPKSWPWHAPEHDRDKFRPSQARKMDFFSYGMLCTWVLFEKCLSGIMPLSQGARWAKQDLMNHRDLSKHIINDLKRDDELIPLVKQLIMAENGIENDKKLTLERFLSSVLSTNPLERNARFQELFDCFGSDRTQIPVMEHDEFQMTECNFEITESTYSLYLADYRVRRHIRAVLEEREAANNDSMLAFQLALCYQIGFGGSRDETKSRNMLKKSGKTKLGLDEAIIKIGKKTKTPHERTGTIFAAMQASGHITAIDSTDEYRIAHKSEEAEAAFRQDLEGLESCNLQGTGIWSVSIIRLATIIQVEGRLKEAEELGLSMIQSIRERNGDDHPYTINGMTHLAVTYRKQGSWKEAEALQIQVIKTNAKLLSEGHPDMLDSKLHLAATYRNLGRWKEAEEVGLEVMETNTRVRGTEHPITLMSMNNVALIYVQQGRWLEAEELQAKIMQTCRSVLGMEHPNTLNAMVNLSVTYTRRGYWRKAEELQLLAVEASKRLIGEEHPDTLNSMTNLDATYVERRLWNKARRLQSRVMEASKRVLGEEHPNTLISMANLASTYSDLQSWNEAKELNAQVVETSKKVFGEDHPSTLISIGNLVANYAGSGQWKEAEKLQVELVKKKKGVFGEMHPTTLTSLVNLAVIHKDQGDVEKAITLLEKCVISEELVLGHDHPDTELALEFLKEWQAGR